MIQLCDKVLFAVPKVLKVSMVGVGVGGDFKREIILSIKLYSSMATKISFVSFHDWLKINGKIIDLFCCSVGFNQKTGYWRNRL